ncbi:MAG: RNA-binding S4 domain-containing protein [Bacteriovoracaceae bacterium]|nr:RNA-binding S4 domain-containing protein [Bacteriovoracaceae bacterium]
MDYNLEGVEFIPLCDLLKVLGLCQTGGHAKLVISHGEVMVDGVVELRKRCKIRKNQTVEYNGQKISIKES